MNFAPATTDFDRNIFKSTDYLVLNEVEAEQLSKLEIGSIEQAKIAGLALIDEYNIQRGVLITLGEKGVLYASKANRQVFVRPCPKVKVVDTSVRILNIF